MPSRVRKENLPLSARTAISQDRYRIRKEQIFVEQTFTGSVNAKIKQVSWLTDPHSPAPSRTFVQWHIVGLFPDYSDRIAGDFHPVLFYPPAAGGT